MVDLVLGLFKGVSKMDSSDELELWSEMRGDDFLEPLLLLSIGKATLGFVGLGLFLSSVSLAFVGVVGVFERSIDVI